MHNLQKFLEYIDNLYATSTNAAIMNKHKQIHFSSLIVYIYMSALSHIICNIIGIILLTTLLTCFTILLNILIFYHFFAHFACTLLYTCIII